VNLPEDRNLIIDSKVSLTAYEQFVNTENEDEIPLYLKKHNDSVKTHIKELAGRNIPNYTISILQILC